ncbi:MAG: diguanylate cyclase, partial [Terracidiphilus sp.]
MKRCNPIFAIIFGWAWAASAASPGVLTTLHAIHSLTHAEAARKDPVDFEATVTYRRVGESTLYLQDGEEGIYVWASYVFDPLPGDRVRITGHAEDSFRPIAVADQVTVLSHGALPEAIPATFDEMIRNQYDCLRVTVRAMVRSADIVLSADRFTTHLILQADGGLIDTYVNTADPVLVAGLLDAEVEASGVAAGHFDGKMQKIGVGLSITSFDDLKIIKRAKTSAWSLPVTQMDEIISVHHADSANRRVRVKGTVTYYQPGSAVVMQNGAKSLWVTTVYEKPLRIGSRIDATGFPDVRDNFLTLSNGEFQESTVYAPIVPLPTTIKELTSSKHLYDLVSIQGQLIMEVREAAQDEYVLLSDGQVFSAIYRHPQVAGLEPLPIKQVPLGSKVTVAGICIQQSSNPFNHEVPFSILMRVPDDISVVAGPSLLNIRNLVIIVGLLLVLVFAVIARSWALERKVRRQTAALAAVEQRRSRILEDINSSRPLAEILEEITEMISFILKGAPCWCEVTDGARLGRCPSNGEKTRLIHEDVPARSGPPLGKLFAALDSGSPALTAEREALLFGVRLASLAIETRRLYTDLRRRSEFDLLTDIHNRFSLEKRLDKQIGEERELAGIFGLIYIDLDKFKQINDLYGHHIGDLYLQEVALRMKRQLRPHDTLARLGGDEFVALVPTVRSRAEVE